MKTKVLQTKHGLNIPRIWMKIWFNNLMFAFLLVKHLQFVNEYLFSYEEHHIIDHILGMSIVIGTSTKLRYSATCLGAYAPYEHFTKICRSGVRTLADYLYFRYELMSWSYNPRTKHRTQLDTIIQILSIWNFQI